MGTRGKSSDHLALERFFQLDQAPLADQSARIRARSDGEYARVVIKLPNRSPYAPGRGRV